MWRVLVLRGLERDRKHGIVKNRAGNIEEGEVSREVENSNGSRCVSCMQLPFLPSFLACLLLLISYVSASHGVFPLSMLVNDNG